MTEKILLASVWGGIASLDTTEAGQTQAFQPIVSGPIIGFLLGDLKTGVGLGIMLQLFFIWPIPLGTAVFPEISVVTPVAISSLIYLNSTHRIDPATNLFFVLLFVLFYSYFTGRIVIYHREWNKKLLKIAEPWVEKEMNLSYLVIYSLLSQFLRGLILSFAGVYLCNTLGELFLKETPFSRISNHINEILWGFTVGFLIYIFQTKKKFLISLLGLIFGILFFALLGFKIRIL